MDCKKIASESSICEKYRQYTEDCICEKQSVSEYSPYPVQDDEYLIRQIYSPIHIDEETGKLTSLAFQDASSKGMSINRKNYISKEKLEQKIENKLQFDKKRGKERYCSGVAIAKCSDIRKLVVKKNKIERRLFCIYDTARKKDESHADICQAISGKKEGSRARNNLREVFSRFPIDIEKLFDRDSPEK